MASDDHFDGILLDYHGYCEEVGIRCDLDCRPRDVNVEADELTNGIFTSFDMRKRVPLEWKDWHLPMEELLMKFSEAFCKRRHDAVDLGAKDGRAKFQKTAWG